MTLARAITFNTFGQPAKVLSVRTLPPLPSPDSLDPSKMVVKFIQSPINPSDINVIQGVYPSKPAIRSQGYYIPGNEGLAQIHYLSARNSTPLSVGDWIIMRKPQLGTWASHAVVDCADVLPLPPDAKSVLSTAHASTLAVNPPTALRMLSDFVQLKPGEYFVQNAANSAVGRAAIQIARANGINSINFIRNRPDLSEIIEDLKGLGATHVCTYDELEDKQFRSKVKDWTGNSNIRLAFNCVGGPVTARMATLLGSDSHLISYGSMSKQPLTLPTSILIFRNLTCHGYWQSRWYEQASSEQINEQMRYLIGLVRRGMLRVPEHQAVVLKGTEIEMQEIVLGTFRQMDEIEQNSRTGQRKVLLSWD